MKTRHFIKYLSVFVGFAALYAVFYWLYAPDLAHEYLDAVSKIPSIRNFGSGSVKTISDLAKAWGPYLGIGFGAILWALSLAMLLILKIVRLARYKAAGMFGLFIVYGLGLALAIELRYFEKSYSAIGQGIIVYVGQPLLIASIGALTLAVLIYAVAIMRSFIKKDDEATEKTKIADAITDSEPEEKTKSPSIPTATMLVMLAASSLFLPGCSLIGDMEGFACLLSPDSAHCYQEEAVGSSNADDCEKIKQQERFKGMGSNPPKDKCFLMVAQNTGDLEVCKRIEGGPMSYTQEECIMDTSVENENPAGCQMLSGQAKQNCADRLGPKMTADKALEIDNQIETIKQALKDGPDANLEAQLKGLEERRNAVLAIMTKDNKAEYERQTDPLNKEIIGDWAVGNFDSETKNKLIDLNERLKKAGGQLTKEQYEAVRDYYKFINDPANDIEKMDDRELAKDKFGDKVNNAVDKLKFWKTKDTEAEKALDEQLRFYERMLARQKGINDRLNAVQTEFRDTASKIGEGLGEYVADKAKDKVIEEIFGVAAEKTAGLTTKVLGEALDEVKAQAKSAEFRGLVKAYNDGLKEELAKAGGDVDRAHAAVVQKLSADPYAYASGNSFAKYGNLIENKECDGTNPHCLNKDVFWKAMKKSYKYQNPTN